MSHGVYWRDEFASEEGKLEIRFLEFFCFNTKKHQEIYNELFEDALHGAGKVFSHQIDPENPKAIIKNGIDKVMKKISIEQIDLKDRKALRENMGVDVVILQYENRDEVFEDLKNAYSYIVDSGGLTYGEATQTDGEPVELEPS